MAKVEAKTTDQLTTTTKTSLRCEIGVIKTR